ncbi:SPOR domain-containing protein [Albidovulum sp.]|uniref:SPOR domain-containing protein n=1 Tax=Albidovulum sp. TaxID=1872424 RepID=UPI003D7CBB21
MDSETKVQSSAVSLEGSVDKEVEAPEVFQLTSKGLWDGRPSLGGTWVAHPDVTDPERVVIRNAANGKSITGALFRLERDNPGPSLQVSSDAAEALGLLAGQPTELSVVALRKQKIELPPAPQPEAEAEATGTATAATGQATTETAAPETEIAAEQQAEQPAKKSGGLFGFLRKKPKPEAEPEMAETALAPEVPGADQPLPENAVVETESAVVDDLALAPEAAAEPARKKSGGLFGFLRKKPKEDPAMAAPVTDGVTSGPIEQAPLDAITGSAAAALDRADAQGTAAPDQTRLERSYIQIATFTAEENATTAADKVKSAGLTATVIPEQGNEKPYWRVVVGPVASVAERDALMTRVKDIGFADAFPVAK